MLTATHYLWYSLQTMAEALTSDPRYSFPKPPEWEGLVACAEAAIVPGQPKRRQSAVVDALWEVLPDIDPEAQERNRYYGLGRVVCKIGKSCFLPTDTRGSIIPDMVDALVRSHPREYNDGSGVPRGLSLNEISLDMATPLTEETRSAYGELSLAERLTIDTLQVLTIEKATWKKRSEESKRYHRKVIVRENTSFNDVRRITFSAASTLFRTSARELIKSRTDILSGILTDTADPFNAPLKTLLSEEEIRTLVPPTTAAGATHYIYGNLPHNSITLSILRTAFHGSIRPRCQKHRI